MLVTDLDGTLLNREAKLSERNKAAVRRAVEKGIPIVLCSGRFPAEGLADFWRELGLDVSGLGAYQALRDGDLGLTTKNVCPEIRADVRLMQF